MDEYELPRRRPTSGKIPFPSYIHVHFQANISQKYAQTPGPYQEKSKDLYSRLRLNLISTVFESWQETGFAWEQYNPETGKGQRTQHFTGWTSLVVKIMGMPDLSGGKWQAGKDEL